MTFLGFSMDGFTTEFVKPVTWIPVAAVIVCLAVLSLSCWVAKYIVLWTERKEVIVITLFSVVVFLCAFDNRV